MNKLEVSEVVINSSFIDDEKILITSKAKQDGVLKLRHDIIRYKDNQILKTYFEPLYHDLTNKNLLFGQNYYFSGNKIISFHYIPFKVDKTQKEYSISDSVNSYYKYNPKVKTLIKVDEL